jgi:hypothetical protein
MIEFAGEGWPAGFTGRGGGGGSNRGLTKGVGSQEDGQSLQ